MTQEASIYDCYYCTSFKTDIQKDYEKHVVFTHPEKPCYPFIVVSFFTAVVSSTVSLLLLGMLYGFVLWIVTLVPIHKPITGFSPFNHPLGRMPALASLGGHIVYGLILGFMIFAFMPNYK